MYIAPLPSNGYSQRPDTVEIHFIYFFLSTIASRISYVHNTFMFSLNLIVIPLPLAIRGSDVKSLQKKKTEHIFLFSLFFFLYQFHVRIHIFVYFSSIPETAQRFQRPTILRTNRSSVIFCRIVSRENSNIQRRFAFTNGKWRIHCIDYGLIGSMRLNDPENTRNVAKTTCSSNDLMID